MTIDQFFSMNGYGFYIWGSYGFAAAILIALVLHTWVRAHETNKTEINKTETNKDNGHDA